MRELVMHLGLDFVGENRHRARGVSRKKVTMNSRESITGAFGLDRVIGGTMKTVHLAESRPCFCESGRCVSNRGTGNGIMWLCARGDTRWLTEQLLYWV